MNHVQFNRQNRQRDPKRLSYITYYGQYCFEYFIHHMYTCIFFWTLTFVNISFLAQTSQQLIGYKICPLTPGPCSGHPPPTDAFCTMVKGQDKFKRTAFSVIDIYPAHWGSARPASPLPPHPRVLLKQPQHGIWVHGKNFTNQLLGRSGQKVKKGRICRKARGHDMYQWKTIVFLIYIYIYIYIHRQTDTHT